MSSVRVVRAVRGLSAAELARRRAVLDYLWERYLAGRSEVTVSLDLPWKKETKS